MYAHQVIESLKKHKKDKAFQKLFPDGLIERWIKDIISAQKFFMETIKDGGIIEIGSAGFSGNNADVRLPYQTTWIDFYRAPDSQEE